MGSPAELFLALYNRLQHPHQYQHQQYQDPESRAVGADDHDDNNDTRSVTSASPSHPSKHLTRSPKPTRPCPSHQSSSRAVRHTAKQASTPRSIFPLLSLPLDILHHLSTFLPPSSQVALVLTSRALYISLPPPNLTGLDECARVGVRSHFEESAEICREDKGKDGGRTRLERERGKAAGRVRCALCKALYPCSLFDRAGFISLDAVEDDGQVVDGQVAGESADIREKRTTRRAGRKGMINVRNRVCKWHDGRFQRTVKRGKRDLAVDGSGGGGRERVVEGWKLEEACMHCGTVLAWEKCTCDCQTCWKREVWCFTRVLEEEEERVKEDVYLRWIF